MRSSSSKHYTHQVQPAQRLTKYSKDDIFIAVMGLTGCGKSTLISKASGQPAPVGDELVSCTSKLDMYSFDSKDRSGRKVKVHLIDTPGFDDTNRPDVEILQEIVFWLSSAYDNGFFLDGIVYLHNITLPRFDQHSRRSLEILKALLGRQNYKSVYLASTFWTEAKELGQGVLDRSYRSYQQLIDTYWKDLIDGGALFMPPPPPGTVGTWDEHAWSRGMLDHFINKGSKHVLQIQTEMRLPTSRLSQTTAAKVAGELWRLDEQRRDQIAKLEPTKMEIAKKWSGIAENDMQVMQQQMDTLRAEIERLGTMSVMPQRGQGQYFDHTNFSQLPPPPGMIEGPEDALKKELKAKEEALAKAQALKMQKRQFMVNVINTSAGVASAVISGMAMAAACQVM